MLINILRKYPWVVLLKYKKGVTFFEKILDESGCKPNKNGWIKVVFYKRSMKSWLQDNDIEMYSTQNQGKSTAAERFRTETLKNTIYKYITSISKYVYIDKLDDIQ